MKPGKENKPMLNNGCKKNQKHFAMDTVASSYRPGAEPLV